MSTTPFGRHKRKIEPYVLPEHPGVDAGFEALEAYARGKAASLNQHLIGYGELAESEWKTAGIAAPDLTAMRHYRLERIRAELRKHDLAGIHLYDPLNIRYATSPSTVVYPAQTKCRLVCSIFSAWL